MTDERVQGRSYGYVTVPPGGKKIDGVTFPAGPRAAGKSGWYPLLVAAGCEVLTEAEYLKALESPPDVAEVVAYGQVASEPKVPRGRARKVAAAAR